jgi:hypothetical protein
LTGKFWNSSSRWDSRFSHLASTPLIEVRLPTCNISPSKVRPFLPYPKTMAKLQEKYWNLSRNEPKSIIVFWELFYEDRNYPNREELAAGVGN